MLAGMKAPAAQPRLLQEGRGPAGRGRALAGGGPRPPPRPAPPLPPLLPPPAAAAAPTPARVGGGWWRPGALPPAAECCCCCSPPSGPAACASPVPGGHPFPAWMKKSIFWWMRWPGKRLLTPTHCRMASPGVSVCSLAPTTLCSGAGDPMAARRCTPGWFALQSCLGTALLTALPFPTATLVPASGRQRMASRLREGLLQQEAAATLPTSTTTAVQKYPVEVSPIPSNDDMVLGLIMVCTVAGISALIVAAVCWCRLQKEVRLAQKADYSAQRAASPLPYDKISPGDKTLAQSAQMYHYQHQKQQMLSMEKHKEEPKLPDSASSDEENEDGDFTVYECPGLAPTGEMEVRNPLFDDSSLHPSNPKSHQ
uniref:Neural proliferation, differentiation and control 1 n=1 Tax=Accipiter nisus TaxID=211598 RepID=A0A8B9MLI1_9AVES